MFAIGSMETPYIFGPVFLYFPAYALNVPSMTCISPTEGWPAFQLESVRLTALGLPPDSWFIRLSVVLTRPRDWWTCPNAWVTTPFQRCTPEPPSPVPLPVR